MGVRLNNLCVFCEEGTEHISQGILVWEYLISGPLLQAIWSPHTHSKSLVDIAGSKLYSLQVGFGLHRGGPLSLMLFIAFMYRLSKWKVLTLVPSGIFAFCG